MDKQAEVKNVLSEFKAFLSGLTGSEEKVEETVVETELSEVVEETVKEEVEASKEDVVEEKVELSAEPTYITKDEFEKFQTELTSVIKETMSALSKDKEELSKEVAKLSAQPAAKAIVHSPESEESKPQGRTYGHGRPMQTIDRVLGEMNKYN